MTSPRTLRDWCRVTCARYPNVEIRNMSTSFRDGLVFCAIIHKHRPELLDFSLLSKDDIYHNNKLAFEIAETKLGIPAMLDPGDMVSSIVPDCLSVLTFLSQLHQVLSNKCHPSPVSWKTSHVSVFNNLTKTKSAAGLKPCQSLTDLKTSTDGGWSHSRPRTACILCFKPVHLIQRRLIDGKVYHRNCFRCKVCNSSLLPGSYSQGHDAAFLFCSHHITEDRNAPPDLHKLNLSTQDQHEYKFREGDFSPGGFSVTSVPHYTKKTESQEGLVCERTETERKETSSEDNRDSAVRLTVEKPEPLGPQPDKNQDQEQKSQGPGPAGYQSQQELTHTQVTFECSLSRAPATDVQSRPVPAPRRRLDPSAAPVPAPRTKTPEPGNMSEQQKFSPRSSFSSNCGSPKVRTNHPWLNLVHPGPWTQLPPAPPPIPAPRSKYGRSWYRPRIVPPNPFAEDMEEEAQNNSTRPELAEQTALSGAAVSAEVDETLRRGDAAACSGEDDGRALWTQKSAPTDTGSAAAGGLAVTVTAGATGEPRGEAAAPDQAEGHVLPRSLSVPAIPLSRCHSSSLPEEMTSAECVQISASLSAVSCRENPFDQKPSMRKSKTFQSLPSRRGPAPGHGFPLIKRKVQSDQDISSDGLRVEMSEVDKHLQILEQTGVQLEQKLRACRDDKEEEKMLMEWFSLVHKRNALVRRDTELVYLTKQQKLEERQADVEYLLRCLLNKPETDWSDEDREQEQKLMDELVAIIEQRNQIISSLDQDRLREKEEDVLLEALMKDKELQKEGIKDLKKSKQKFNPTKMFKLLNHKAESTDGSVDRKS